MSVIELTRQLGAAIQADERYKAFDEAKKANDAEKQTKAKWNNTAKNSKKLIVQ